MAVILEPHRRRLQNPEALDEHLVMAIDQDVGNRRILEQGFERPEPEQFVEHVGDELLALGIVERVALFAELLDDDRADLILDLRARAGFERGQVDEVEQPLVKLDLELGVRLVLAECAGIAGGEQAALLFVALGRVRARGGAAALVDLPQAHRVHPKAAATPVSSLSRSRASGPLRRMSASGTPRSIASVIVS